MILRTICEKYPFRHTFLHLVDRRLTLPIRDFIPQHMAANVFKQLNISFRHVTKVESLEFHHRDPFDRVLIAQAREEGLTIITADRVFQKYDVDLL